MIFILNSCIHVKISVRDMVYMCIDSILGQIMRIIDLTFTIQEGMNTYPVPWHPIVEISQMGRLGIENRETHKITIGTHTGTHIDAPRHFFQDGKTVDEISLDVLIGPAYILDFTKIYPHLEIGISILKEKLGDLSIERIIFRFDWDNYWGTKDYYLNHPFLSLEAAQLLVEKGVKLIAIDTPMPDNPLHGSGNEPDSPIHKYLLKNDVVIVEYLCNLKDIKSDKVQLIVLPLKIKDGDGSPARCIAIEKYQ